MRIMDWSSDVCSSDLRLVPSSSQPLSDIRQVERRQLALLKLTVFTGCSASQSDLIGFAHRNEHRRMRAEDNLRMALDTRKSATTQAAQHVCEMSLFGRLLDIGRASCMERVCQYV